MITYNLLAVLYKTLHLILTISLEAELNEECMGNICSTNGIAVIIRYLSRFPFSNEEIDAKRGYFTF